MHTYTGCGRVSLLLHKRQVYGTLETDKCIVLFFYHASTKACCSLNILMEAHIFSYDNVTGLFVEFGADNL